MALPDLWRWGTLVHPGRNVSTRVTVTGLYGIASPGCTINYQLENILPGGVFPGVRLFNMDAVSFDPVPWITVLLNFQHAKSQAIQLVPKGQQLVKHEGGTFDARWQPLTSAILGKSISFKHHLGPEYMRRILAFNREVSITILAGQNFSVECVLGGMNPYIEVQVMKGDEDDKDDKDEEESKEEVEKYFTSIKRVSPDSMSEDAFVLWNESFLLSSYEPGKAIQLSAWNDCTFDFKMGSVVLPSDQFDPRGFAAAWISLEGVQLEISLQIEHLQF